MIDTVDPVPLVSTKPDQAHTDYEYDLADGLEKDKLEAFKKAKAEHDKLLEQELATIDAFYDGQDQLAKVAADKRKQEAADIEKTWGRVGDAISQAMADVATGTMSVGQAMRSVLRAGLSMILDMAKAHIMAAALETGAEGAKSQAGIPVIGPILAVGAMAAMIALVSGLIGSLPSAAGGWDRVPGTTLAMLHRDEQVLSAPYAQGLRDLIANGGAKPAATNVYLTITAVDAKSVERLFHENEDAFIRTFSDAVKNGRI